MTEHSKIFESGGKLEKGLKLSKLSGSKLGFFQEGCDSGGDESEPVVKRQVFMMLAKTGVRVGMQGF